MKQYAIYHHLVLGSVEWNIKIPRMERQNFLNIVAVIFKISHMKDSNKFIYQLREDLELRCGFFIVVGVRT